MSLARNLSLVHTLLRILEPYSRITMKTSSSFWQASRGSLMGMSSSSRAVSSCVNLSRIQLIISEQKKSALKKVSDELDEAEEIVSIYPNSTIMTHLADRSDGSGATFNACVNPANIPTASPDV